MNTYQLSRKAWREVDKKETSILFKALGYVLATSFNLIADELENTLHGYGSEIRTPLLYRAQLIREWRETEDVGGLMDIFYHMTEGNWEGWVKDLEDLPYFTAKTVKFINALKIEIGKIYTYCSEHIIDSSYFHYIKLPCDMERESLFRILDIYKQYGYYLPTTFGYPWLNKYYQ